MTARLTILASGSAGNSALVDVDGIRVLIDVGLEPRDLEARMSQVGLKWEDLSGVLITHRHTDHWRPATFAKLLEQGVPIHCHRDHVAAFRTGCRDFDEIESSKLVRVYVTNRPVRWADSWECRPFRVRHDGGATFGFRFDRLPALAPLFEGREKLWSFAYVADLGCWDDSIVTALLDVDLLALEFNHDPTLLQGSNRPPWLIGRVLGDEGHLSNAQAAALLRQALQRSSDGRLRQLVLLHLSRECNQPGLARAAAEAVLLEYGRHATAFVAEQDQPSPMFVVGESHRDLRLADSTGDCAGDLQRRAQF
jgi:ribonuclease BN (tRNA processing enzyme)